MTNLTGASGVIGHEAIADADPDSYTIGMITWELSSYVPQDMSEYNHENYIPICRVNTDAAAITVNTKWAADNNVTDLDSFVAYCKDHPGEVTMGGSSSGSVWHVGGGYLMNEAGIDIKMITYQDGAASAAKAAAQGEITGVTISAAEARSFVESGDLTMLAIMSAERNPVFPDVLTCVRNRATTTASGVPGAESRCLSVSMTMSSPALETASAQLRSKILTSSSSWPTPARPSPT